MDSWGGVAPDEVIGQSHEAFVVMDDAGIVRAWNASAERMFGFDAVEATGSRLSDLIIPPRYRELHERGLRSYLDTGVGPVLGTTIEIEGVDRLGRIVPVELTINVTRRDGRAWFHAFLNDITHRRRIERMLRADARVAWACANDPGKLELSEALAAIGEEMSYQLGLAWLPGSRGALTLHERWTPNDLSRAFAIESETSSFERGVGLPGSTWKSGEPIWSTDVSEDPGYVRRSSAQQLGFRSGLFVPIGRGDSCRGVLEFLTVEWRDAGPELLERVARLGERLGRHVRT